MTAARRRRTAAAALREAPPPSAIAPSIGVLHVVLSLAPGGSERITIEICKRMPAGIRTAVCCLDEAGAWAHQLTDRGIPVVALNRRPGFRPSIGARIARIARAHRAQVIHCHGYSSFVYGRIAALLVPGTKVVFTEQGRVTDRPPSAKRTLANAVLGRLRSRIFAVSRELRDFMIAEGFPARRVEVVRNAIDPLEPPMPDDRRRARRLLGIPETAIVIGTAARLDPVKDLTTLVQAFAQVHSRIFDALLLVVGDGPERQRLEHAARACGVATSSHFTGHRDDVRSLLPAMDVYVNCSTTEGTSVTILEAMAASVPIVATGVGGTPELVVNDRTGLLVPPRDPAALAAALAALAGDPSRARALGEAGRARVVEHFGIDGLVDHYLGVYRSETTGATNHEPRRPAAGAAAVVRGRDAIRQAYRDERVASAYIAERFQEPLGALLHARQARRLKQIVRESGAKRILEIAPGPARLTTEIAATFDGAGTLVDTSAQMFAEARRRLDPVARRPWRFVCGDAFGLPFDAAFDLVYVFRLIRHFDAADRARAYAQIARALRPGGLLVFDAINADVYGPFRARMGGAALKHYDAPFTADGLARELAEAGFDLLALEPVQRRYPLLYRLQVLVAPRSRGVARAAMELVDRLGGGPPLEWVVTCRRR